MNMREQVFHMVEQVPFGKVATYGMIAQLIDKPRAARQVGWMLATLPSGTEVPWWRVVNRFGYLSIRNDDMDAKFAQLRRLEDEGIEVSNELTVDLKKYLWQAPVLPPLFAD